MPPATIAAAKSQGDAAGATAPATKPATTRAPESSVRSARRSRNQGTGGAPPVPWFRERRHGLALHRVVAETPHRGEHAAQVGLGRIDGDGQDRGAEVDVGGAHPAFFAERALQLDGAVGAIHAGDVQHAALGAVLPRERQEQVELTVVVDGDGAMVGAVCLGAGATREGANVFGAQGGLVEADVEKAARDVRLDGVHAIEADVPRGLLNVRFDESTLGADEVRTFARRAGAQAHCADHCPVAVHDHGQLDLLAPLPGEDGSERRMLHVTGMDCADCAVKLQGALRKERGVRAADVNFGAATLTVAIDPAETDLGGVFTAVRRLGYDTVERKSMPAAGTPRSLR